MTLDDEINCYVMRWHSQRECLSTIQIVGPFLNDDVASKWSMSERNNPEDNPCWQIVYLRQSDLLRPVRVYSPDDAPLQTNQEEGP